MLQTRIRRGERDRLVTFIKPVYVTNSTNEDKIDYWKEIDSDPTTWARKKELPGQEVMIADRVTYMQRTIFNVDYRIDLTVINRVVCDGRVYEIISITEPDVTRGTSLDVMANLLDTEVWT